MKILIYSHTFAPNVGGVESIVMSLTRGLIENAEDRRLFSVVPTVVTRTEAGTFDDATLPFQIVRKPTFARLLSLVRESDVVHIAGPAIAPMFASYILGKPFVVEHHTYQSICPNGLLILQPSRSICPGYFQAREYARCLSCRRVEVGALRGLLSVLAMFPRRFLLKRARANIGVSRHVVARTRLANSRLIYHGIEESQPQAVASSAGLTNFAFVGRFVPEKGISVLLKACAILRSKSPDFRLRLIGDGPERKNVEEMIASLNLEGLVEITGFLSGPSMDAALADVGA